MVEISRPVPRRGMSRLMGEEQTSVRLLSPPRVLCYVACLLTDRPAGTIRSGCFVPCAPLHHACSIPKGRGGEGLCGRAFSVG
jgi:hypothetical protein